MVRWQHPKLGNVAPTEFLNIASERGLIPRLSRYIFDQVGRDISQWQSENISYGQIALNIHPVDLKSPNLLLASIDRLERKGLTPRDMMFEVTEGCFVGRGSDAAFVLLEKLAGRGYCISLDDFGTGHASLSHLRRLPVKELKIDRSFISDLEEQGDDHAIVAATAEIARGMGIRCVAEGVEAQAQRDILKKMGIKIGQGYLWSPPLPAPDFARFVQNQPGKLTA